MKQQRTIVVGLTGSIGAGKTTTARLFAELGAAVFNADKIVHGLLSADGAAFAKVAEKFPLAVRGKRLCRKRLARLIFSDKKKKKEVEEILHPLVWKQKKIFLKQARKEKRRIAILEIPLLFETGEEKNVDISLCVIASKKIQEQRVLKRKNMTLKKWRAILRGQLSDKEKKSRADYILRTDKGLADTRRQVRALWQQLLKEEDHA